LAYLLQGVIAAIILANAAGAQDKPFSHRQHLALKLSCTTCHQSVTSSTKAEDNNLPGAAVCASCHTDGRTPKPPTKRQVDKFNHQIHTKFGNIAPMIRAAIAANQYLDLRSPAHLDTTNACASCHHGIEQSDDVKQASVHPQMADCLICHNKIDTPYSCEKCHNNPVALKPATHSRDFIDRHNRKNEGLDRSSCFSCHGKRFTCLGCH
jgi:transcription elongation factor Elf1